MQDVNSEATVVAAARAGDSAAFESLFRRHYRSVHAIAYHLTGDGCEAEDVAQMVFVRVAKAIRRFRSNARFKTWLYRITVNVVKDQAARAETRRQALEGFAACEAAKRAGCGPGGCGISDPQSVIRAALLGLPHKERAAIVLTACLDMTHSGAAEILECSEGTMSWRVHRAKGMIRSCLNQEGEDG